MRPGVADIVHLTQDTTASALSWMFYELSQHPEVVEKIRREILDRVGPTRIPTSDDLKSMKYLQVRRSRDPSSFDSHLSHHARTHDLG